MNLKIAHLGSPNRFSSVQRRKTLQQNDQVVPYPKIRRLLAAFLRPLQRTPTIHGLIEVDVTRARAFLREHQANTGESLSFTAFIATCLGKAVDENKAMQARRKGSKHLVLFDEVDVYTPIERDVAGQKQNITHIIRAANRKTFRVIHQKTRKENLIRKAGMNRNHRSALKPSKAFAGSSTWAALISR